MQDDVVISTLREKTVNAYLLKFAFSEWQRHVEQDLEEISLFPTQTAQALAEYTKTLPKETRQTLGQASIGRKFSSLLPEYSFSIDEKLLQDFDEFSLNWNLGARGVIQLPDKKTSSAS